MHIKSPKKASDTDFAQQLLSVPRAARLLGVHPSTIRRWIDQGALPAYRIGQRRVGVRQSELAGLVSPREPLAQGEQVTIHRLTPAEKRRGLRALAELERLDEELLAKRSGESFAPSWRLLNEARDQRTRDLMRGSEE